ncbi:MAG: hypothetical protein ACO1Q7_08980 [Gemmatimonas sp.]
MRFPPLFASACVVTVMLSVATSVRGSVASQPRVNAPDVTRSNDPIARLQAQMDSGKITLQHDTSTGYLVSMLRALRIPESTQGFVFSRTSLQTDLISPWSPRALYFNDDVYVGYVQGSEFIEIATVSPSEGAVFYTFNQEPTGRPAFKRDDTCLSCHRSKTTGGLPGFMVLSSVTDKSGYFLTSRHSGPTTDATPINDRFAGYYVTGQIAGGSHSGNVLSTKAFTEIGNRASAGSELNFTAQSKRDTVGDLFNTSHYLNKHSDLVALMVLTHQTSVHNTIWRVHDLAVKALREDSAVSRYNKDTTFAQTKVVTSPKLQQAIDQLVRELMFVGEAPLPGPMKGTSTFTKDFAALGPHDAKGRSLRDFDLQSKMFRYPVSFLIYSEGFNALPDVTRRAIYQRLRAVLTGEDTNIDFAGISGPDRTAALEILRATKPEFDG